MDHFNVSDILPGENCTFPDNFSIFEKCESSLPAELTQISESSLHCVIAYCIIFVVATSGNLIVLTSLKKNYKTTKSRINLLFLHLAIADLIVCCTLIPTEVFWRITIQWKGGNVLCKVTQFLRAFGLYLSSLVLICVSFDRFLAIVFPLSVLKMGSFKKIKMMLGVAWITAAVFSIPQAIYFGVVSHPEFPSFQQCVTNHFLDNSQAVEIYSIFSVAAMYFVPLLVILCTYAAILWKIVRKSNQRSSYKVQFSTASNGQSESVSSIQIQEGGNPRRVQEMNQLHSPVRLRTSTNAEATMSKAKTRTLIMTIVIVVAFVVCWTPYAVMTLWYMVDWKEAEKVDPRIQEVLFLMAVANSSINPLIYGCFNRRRVTERRGAARNSTLNTAQH